LVLKQMPQMLSIEQQHCYAMFFENLRNMIALTDMVFDHIQSNTFLAQDEKAFYGNIANIYWQHKHPIQYFLNMANFDGQASKHEIEVMH